MKTLYISNNYYYLLYLDLTHNIYLIYYINILNVKYFRR